MELIIKENTVDLCKSCEKNWEACDAYDGEYFYGSGDKNVCCCEKYVPIMSREDMDENPTGQCGELISRQQAIDAIEKLRNAEVEHYGKKPCKGYWELTAAMEMMRSVPSAEPQTFTVIDTKTGKEADTYKIALKEEWAKSLCYCDMEGFAIEEDGTLILLDECGRCAYCPEGRFEVEWDG